MAEFTPDTGSATYAAMTVDWALIRAVRGGTRAVRAAGEAYLPKFESEDQEDYNRRLKHAPFSAHYEDATRSLAAKPFSREVKLQGEVSDDIRLWCENIDMAGSNLHVFTHAWFVETLHMGASYVLVDYPQAKNVRTVADEKGLGIRPYVRLIPADEMLAVYEGYRNGRVYIRQIRFRDNELRLVDMEETVVQRVRVLDDIDGVISLRVFEKAKENWVEVEGSGVLQGIDVIPIVPLIFGLPINGRFGVKPTMLDLANTQIKHYQHSSRIEELFNYAGFPMLQAKGMGPAFEDINGVRTMVKVKVGPKAVLYAAPANDGDKPEWGFVQPDPAIIKEAREQLKDIEGELRTLGLQPSTPSVGLQNVAATTSAINSARTHSAVQAWAMMTKDALEQVLVFMARWAKQAETAEAYVHTDFSAEVLKDADEKVLLEAKTLGYISWETWADEMMRRDLLGPQFDKEVERERLESDDPLGMGTGEQTEDAA